MLNPRTDRGCAVDHLRVGILGAARIAPDALVKPARAIPEVTVAAIAARDPERARRFAGKHGIATVHSSYADLLADPGIDAVYNPLPNSLHAPWTLAAIEAGKHVLCEKPFTSNAREARAVADAAAVAGLVVTEAFHYRYHPLAERMRSIAGGGELGRIREISAWACFPRPKSSDIRYDYSLGGGALMDGGCYALHCLRMLGTGTPEVTAATALLRKPRVDRAMTAHLVFPDGVSGRLVCSLWSRQLVRISARVTGDRGEMRVINYMLPHLFNRLSVIVDGKRRRERVPGEPTYTLQLRAFVGSVLRGEPVLTPAEDAVVTMALIDDIYRKSGLPIRGQA
jgi:predicted dehydrogenase